MDLSIVSKFMSLTPDMMYKATKMVESAQAYFPGDVDSQEQYLQENLIDQTLEYALTLLEDKKVRDYMGVNVYTNGTTFSAPTLALYNVASMPEMKQRIQAKLNAKGNVRKEGLDPVGREDADIDNDGKPNDKNDKYIRRRRSAVSAAIAKRKQRNEEVELDEAMVDGPRKDKMRQKEFTAKTSSDRANAFNIGTRNDTGPSYQKKSTGGKGSRYPGYGDQGAGNKAKRRAGQEPLRGTRDPRNEEFVAEEDPCWKGYTQVGMKKKGGREVPNCVPSKGVPKAKGYKSEELAEFAADYFIAEGLNEYGIDILIEDLGIDAFCDYIQVLAEEEEMLLEWRRGAGGTKVRGSGTSKSGKSIGSLKGGAKASAIRGTAEHKARKAEKEKESSKSSGMTASLKSQSKVANAKKSQPATKSTPTQTKEKSKGGILGALKARAQKDIKSVQQSVNTARQVGARRAAEVKATYDAVRARGKAAEQSASATRARRKATVAAGRAAQAAGRTAVKAAGAAGAAAGSAVAAKKAGKSNAAAAGRAAGTFVKKMTKEEKELLTHYFIESEIAFNYDEVQEIFESFDQEHFDYYIEKAMMMVEESEPTALEMIQEKLGTVFGASDFNFSDWRHLTEKTASDEATGKFVRLTQTNRTDNTPDVRGKRKDGVIINPQVDMRREEVEPIEEKAPPGAKYERMVKHIKKGYSKDGLTKKEKSIAYATAWKAKNKQQQEQADPQAAKAAAKNQQQMKTQDQMRRKQLMLQQQKLQMQKQGKLPTGHAMEEVEHVDEATRYSQETGKSFRTGKPVVKGGSAKNDKAFQAISKMMGSGRAGVQPRGQKKEPGKKPPAAGEYGGPKSPAQKVAARRAAAQKAKDMMHSRFD